MADLISSIAQLMWPLIVLTGILVFRRGIGRVLRTAERRELDFEIGGQRVTLHELNDQQNQMIQDLQHQLSKLSAQLESQDRSAEPPVGTLSDYAAPSLSAESNTGSTPDTSSAPDTGSTPDSGWAYGASPAPAAPPKGDLDSEATHPGVTKVQLPTVQVPVSPDPFAVLWVDDRPTSNAMLVEQLRDNGVRVALASTTAEALGEIQQRPYRLIISDMARQEDGRAHPDAGLALVRELRDLGVDTPVIIFSSQHGHLAYGAQAQQAGAVATTTSAYEMIKHFQNFGLL